jgi:hypothetical protein
VQRSGGQRLENEHVQRAGEKVALRWHIVSLWDRQAMSLCLTTPVFLMVSVTRPAGEAVVRFVK